jgi:two-component system KDP operon response regulator KdpE
MSETVPLRILLVEDQPLNRDLVHAIVSRTTQPPLCDASLTDAHDLAQARALVAAGEFDIVLLDVQLPDGSGLALLDALANGSARRRPAVIALTGGVLPQQRAAALEAGCDAVLEKPFLAADLISLATLYAPA